MPIFTYNICNTSHIGKTLDTATYIDDKAREWAVVYTEHIAAPNKRDVFVATWVNRFGFKNVSVFVKGQNNTWMTDPDGPFATPGVKEAYRREKRE